MACEEERRFCVGKVHESVGDGRTYHLGGAVVDGVEFILKAMGWPEKLYIESYHNLHIYIFSM